MTAPISINSSPTPVPFVSKADAGICRFLSKFDANILVILSFNDVPGVLSTPFKITSILVVEPFFSVYASHPKASACAPDLNSTLLVSGFITLTYETLSGVTLSGFNALASEIANGPVAS